MNKGTKIKSRLAAVAASGMLVCGVQAATPKALVVMLDGFRADVLENAIAPNMKRLVEGKWQNGDGNLELIPKAKGLIISFF